MEEDQQVHGKQPFPKTLKCGCTYHPNDYHTEGQRLYKCNHGNEYVITLIRPRPFFLAHQRKNS